MSKSKKLSPREAEILQDIAEGMSTKLIALKYAISINTAKVHRHNIILKTGANNTAHAAILCFGK